MDQRGFDNQRAVLSAQEAAALLGVKLPTLYAYTSRGLLRRVAGDRPNTSAYLRDDVERLRTRAAARSGHAPVAAAALRWGEPVLESSITEITERGPVYRGHAAVDLARDGASFERVAELLWTGALPDTASFQAPASLRTRFKRAHKLVPQGAHAFTSLQVIVPALGAADPERFASPAPREWERARGLIALMAAGAAPAKSVAEGLLRSLGVAPGRAAVRLMNQALVVCADHELNASSFAARVAASTGADLYACVSAALAALSGPRHGGATDRFEAFLAEARRERRPKDAVNARLRRGEEVPGFGHPLYPKGDPRTILLLELAAPYQRKSAAVRAVFEVDQTMRNAGREHATLDVGLVAVASALRLPPGGAAAIFAIGRAAGWVAHALEQRAQGVMLRPRARYVPTPSVSAAP